MHNYRASTVYGAVTLLIAAATAYVFKERTALYCVLWASAFAWAACYTGAAYDELKGEDDEKSADNAIAFWVLSLAQTSISVALVTIALYKITW